MDGFSNSKSSSFSSFSPPPPPPPPVCPKSPPGGLDLFGKRRQLLKVQILEREIGLLQEELKTIEGLQPASRCCKELEDFIGAKQDPLVAINEEAHKSCRCCKRLCCLPWFRCSSCCTPRTDKPKRCACSCLNLCSCLQKMSCQNCCKFTCFSGCHRHRRGGCCCFSSSLCNCTKVNLCCGCSKTCNCSPC